ncbi:hypothetical protein [Bathymodiolus septemdierum thioautotrophic gill symbiont]|uniref:Lipoprotein n=1 Tax=endosymbiont of Bathymodiolus septemdierum str. Myojin knoll TaxID=1303921 RepID=A0A0P0UTE6_9GAMM|nr:hypothetical protein [Bathymodiolus septemdierum thioautotrophic gill symbiont]BAS68397.1 hypothetical protein BSEPE_1419 [endosymbiont of Bathymodiolus septemdierum str. Myojin knoll]
MKHYTKQITKLFLTGFLSLILVACDNEERLNYFNQQVNKNIQDKNSVIVNVKDLTNFEWDKVCFVRYDGYSLPYIPKVIIGSDGKIVLNFYIEQKEEEVESFELSFENYYLDEDYVASTPGCLNNKEKLLLFRHPNSSDKSIDFLMPDTKQLRGRSIKKFL